MLEIKQLHKSYAIGDSSLHVLKGIDLSVAQGEMVAIMGSSGSGKSTLVRCFSRLHDITGGTISVEGQDIMSLPEKELIDLRRSKMGMVFQSFGLLPHRSVLDNVAFPLEMRGQDKHARRERALEVIKLVGLEGREDYFPRELSGGQQQRVGIARTLLKNPPILLLDEATSALDTQTEMEIQAELKAMGHGRTVITIAHRLSTIAQMDRILVMEQGRIVEDGTHAVLLAKRGLYAGFWNRQSGGFIDIDFEK